MSKIILFRDATKTDFSAIACLAVAAYQEYRDRLTEDNWLKMRQSLSNVSKTAIDADFILAEVENKIVGAIAYYPPGKSNPKLFDPNWSSLRLLAVAQNYRGQGIGKRLTEWSIERAKQNQAEVIGLYTSEVMITAQKMYSNLGFKRDRELPSMLGLRYWLYLLPLNSAISN